MGTHFFFCVNKWRGYEQFRHGLLLSLWTGSLVEDGAKREATKGIEGTKESGERWRKEERGGERPRRYSLPAEVRPFQLDPVHKIGFAIHLTEAVTTERQRRVEGSSRWRYSPGEEKKLSQEF